MWRWKKMVAGLAMFEFYIFSLLDDMQLCYYS